MAKKPKGLELFPIDHQLFEYLHATKAVTFTQINRDILTQYTLKSVANRIRKLENVRLVTGNVNRMLLGKEKYINLTRKAFDLYVAKGFEKRIELKSDAVIHDVNLVDIRFRFMKSKAVLDYVTENQIQTWNMFDRDEQYSLLANLNSDAIAKVRIGDVDVSVPIEYDRNSKTNVIYDNLLRKYYTREDVAIVFFVAETAAIRNQIRTVESKLVQSSDLKFFYVLKQELLDSESLSFVNCNDDVLQLD